MNTSRYILVFLLALIVAYPVSEAFGRSYDIVFDRGTIRIDGDRRNGVDYVDLRELLDAFDARIEWDATAQRLRAALDGRIWVFWGNSALVSIDGEVGGLGDPVISDHGRLLAPLQTLSALMSQFSGMSARVVDGELHVERREFTVYGYDIEQRSNGTLIDLHVSGQPPYEVFLSEGNYINLTLHRTIIDASELSAKRPSPLVREVKAVQFDSSAQISFRLRDPFEKYVVSRGDGPGRLNILVGDDLSPNWAATSAPPVFENRLGTLDRIVIDAGHGGRDRGAESLDGVVAEKDIALAVAERLKDRLDDDRRFDVIMTREGDYDMPDEERIRLTNVSDADLFVSIHATAFESEAGRGCQTFFFGQPLNDRARIIMAAVNASADDAGAADTLGPTPFGSTYQHASAELARMIQANLESVLPIPSRGVGQGTFQILDRVDVPAVIVCVASVTNLEDEDYLRRRSFQKDIAEAIHEAIIEYRNKVTSGPVSLGDQ